MLDINRKYEWFAEVAHDIVCNDIDMIGRDNLPDDGDRLSENKFLQIRMVIWRAETIGLSISWDTIEPGFSWIDEEDPDYTSWDDLQILVKYWYSTLQPKISKRDLRYKNNKRPIPQFTPWNEASADDVIRQMPISEAGECYIASQIEASKHSPCYVYPDD